MHKHDYEQFAEKLGLRMPKVDLLIQAFTHRSYVNEHPDGGSSHNERLEFLGDAVVELSVTEFLFGKFPGKSEGELTNFRAALVNTDMLARVALDLGFNEYLRLSRGEAKDKGKARHVILADTFEAVVGALYLSSGYVAADAFLSRVLFGRIDEVIATRSWKDPKSLFQEQAQEHDGQTPSYRVLKEEGPDHDKWFLVGVFLGNVQVASGEGSSKQEAETEAAKAGLATRGW